MKEDPLKLPTHITIEVTTVCDIDPPCVMCGKHVTLESGWVNRDAVHFPKELIPKLEPVLRRAEWLALHGIGEPLTCPYLFDFIPLVPKTCYTTFTSNGLLLGKHNYVDKILAHQISMIDFSLDAGTPEIYRRIRHNDLNQVTTNIKKLVDERNRRGLRFPGVCLNMCLMRENMGDAAAFVRLAHEIGANHAYLFHMNAGQDWTYDWFHYSQQHCHLEPERHDQCIQEAVAEAQRLHYPLGFKGQAFFNPDLHWPSLRAPDLPCPADASPSPKPALVCDMPWRNIIVFCDGRVNVCCWQGDNIGNLWEASIERIWHGAAVRGVREALEKGGFDQRCTSGLLCAPRGRI